VLGTRVSRQAVARNFVLLMPHTTAVPMEDHISLCTTLAI
jgi:hypothetical protein